MCARRKNATFYRTQTNMQLLIYYTHIGGSLAEMERNIHSVLRNCHCGSLLIAFDVIRALQQFAIQQIVAQQKGGVNGIKQVQGTAPRVLRS